MAQLENVFITGGAGFIGTALCKYFLDKGYRVTVFDIFTRDAIQYFPNVLNNKNLIKVQLDVRKQNELRDAIDDASLVFN